MVSVDLARLIAKTIKVVGAGLNQLPFFGEWDGGF